MARISEGTRATVRAQRSLRASRSLKAGLERPLTVRMQGRNRLRNAITEAHDGQSPSQTPNRTSIVEMLTGSAAEILTGFVANLERDQQTTIMGDDLPVSAILYRGSTKDQVPSQLEGAEIQNVAADPFDVSDSDWEFIGTERQNPFDVSDSHWEFIGTERQNPFDVSDSHWEFIGEEDVSRLDPLREPDPSGVQRTGEMTPDEFPRRGRGFVLDYQELTRYPFEAKVLDYQEIESFFDLHGLSPNATPTSTLIAEPEGFQQILTSNVPENWAPISRGQRSAQEENNSLHPIAREFAKGVIGSKPNTAMIHMVDRIIRAVLEETEGAEYSVDEDGALSFEAPLKTGLFIMCEVSLAGNINAGLYHSPDGDLDRFLARPTEDQLLGLL